jgi:hypothetical protein
MIPLLIQQADIQRDLFAGPLVGAAGVAFTQEATHVVGDVFFAELEVGGAGEVVEAVAKGLDG